MFSEKLKQLRKSLGLTQTAFGEKLGVSIDVIRNLECRRTTPTELFIKHLCDVYNVNREWLEDSSEEMFDSPSDADLLQKLVSGAGGNEFVLALARSWLKLDEAQREVLNRFIDEVVEDYRSGRAESALAATAEAVEAAAAELEDISSENQLAN